MHKCHLGQIAQNTFFMNVVIDAKWWNLKYLLTRLGITKRIYRFLDLWTILMFLSIQSTNKNLLISPALVTTELNFNLPLLGIVLQNFNYLSTIIQLIPLFLIYFSQISFYYLISALNKLQFCNEFCNLTIEFHINNCFYKKATCKLLSLEHNDTTSHSYHIFLTKGVISFHKVLSLERQTKYEASSINANKENIIKVLWSLYECEM